MNLLLAVVAGLWYWYAMCRVGYTLQHIFCQPLVMAVPFGLIMGDLSTALIIGAGIEMMYVGLEEIYQLMNVWQVWLRFPLHWLQEWMHSLPLSWRCRLVC